MVPAMASVLAERGHDVTVFTAGADPGRWREGGVETVKLRRLRRRDAKHDANFAHRMLPHLLRGKFDAVHSFGPWDAWASVRAAQLLKGRHRTVYTELGVPLRRWLKNRPERRPHDVVVRGVDYYGCMSWYALDSLHSEFGRDGVLTYGGVDLEEFAPAPTRTPEPVVLFSGAMAERRKGVPVLLEALPLLARTEPDVRVWLSGPGDVSGFLAAAPPEARRRTDVLGVGESHRQAERYGRAWVTTLPSMFDSFGMALAESLACGTPIVTTTHGAPPELVSEGTGVSCEPEDPAALATALARGIALARDPSTVARCRESARRFDWRTSLVPRFEEFYAGTASRAETREAGRTR